MSFDRLQADILNAREARDAALAEVLARHPGTVVFAATALPGPNKRGPGAEALFSWLMTTMRGSGMWRERSACDVLGPYAVYVTARPSIATKRRCLRIEAAHGAARLLDLDVYKATGRRIGRIDLGLAPRPCLVCNQPAFDCIRTRRHPIDELLRHVDRLLDTLPDAALCTRAD